jgi:hypothetical protein
MRFFCRFSKASSPPTSKPSSGALQIKAAFIRACRGHLQQYQSQQNCSTRSSITTAFRVLSQSSIFGTPRQLNCVGDRRVNLLLQPYASSWPRLHLYCFAQSVAHIHDVSRWLQTLKQSTRRRCAIA